MNVKPILSALISVPALRARTSAAALALCCLAFGSSALHAQTNQEYRIGPEDVLHISVWQEEDLDREVLVRPDGGISFPLAGDLQVSGRTPLEVQDEIRARLQRFVPAAEVTVSVETVSGYTIFVLGEVNNPGQFTLGRYVDVLQALTLAGGTTAFADERDVTIRRRQDGEEVILPFNYRSAKRGGAAGQNVILQSGDVVVVP